MLIWVCALHCEARPVIDYYRLRKSRETTAFDLYLGDDRACIVSGVGKIASAAASAWIAAHRADRAPFAWMNLGIAGAATQALGTAFYVNQVVDADSGQRYYPVPLRRSILPVAACVTLAQPSRDYDETRLFDMEASGFAASALRFSSAELLACVKVVSDNRDEQTGRDRQAVSALIAQNLDAVRELGDQLLGLRDELARHDIDDETWRRFLALARFSETRRIRLRELLRYLLAREYAADALLDRLAGQSDSRAILATLERIGHEDAETLGA